MTNWVSLPPYIKVANFWVFGAIGGTCVIVGIICRGIYTPHVPLQTIQMIYGIYNCNFNSNGNTHISLLGHCASNGPDDGHVDRNW